MRSILNNILLLILLSSTLQAQLLDDSTKMVYGPKTTLYTSEYNVRHNDDRYDFIDTTLHNFHRYSLIEKSDYTLQNLGNLGTALNSLLFTLPQDIGAAAGFNAYNPYFKNNEELRYYDTRSPYTYLDIVLADINRNIVNAGFSQNITSDWNFGIDVTRYTMDKILAPEKSKGDRQVDATSIGLYTDYASKNSKYRVLANMSFMSHKVDEQGGIVAPEDEIDIGSYYSDPSNNSVWLREAESKDKRLNWHLYQQYKLGDKLEVYHILDKKMQRVSFDDYKLSSETDGFLEPMLIADDSTQDRTVFRELNNELGIKGDLTDKLYYNAYVKRRYYKNTYRYLDINGAYIAEDRIGGALRYRFSPKGLISFNTAFISAEDHKYGLDVELPWLTATYTRMAYSPTYLQQRYFGNHDIWENSFEHTWSDNLSVRVNYENDWFKIAPELKLNKVYEHIYFDSIATPQQAKGGILIASPSLRLNLRAGKFHLDNHAIYTDVSGSHPEVFRIPTYMLHSSFYYENILFNGMLHIQAGVEVHYKSSYDPYAYNPVLMQFYVQDEYTVPNYLVADVFANIKIDRVRFFLKYNHLNQAINNSYYFMTHGYTGMPSTFDFGVSWPFFD